MTRLWQRNLLGAAVSVVALTVIVYTSLWSDWSDYLQSTDPQLVVAARESGEVAGTTWRVESTRYLNTSADRFEPELPEGTLLHVVTVESAAASPSGCAGLITDGSRRWSAETVGGYGPLPPDGIHSFCGKSGLTQFSFLLPSEVTPTAVDITDRLGRIQVRLLL